MKVFSYYAQLSVCNIRWLGEIVIHLIDKLEYHLCKILFSQRKIKVFLNFIPSVYNIWLNLSFIQLSQLNKHNRNIIQLSQLNKHNRNFFGLVVIYNLLNELKQHS